MTVAELLSRISSAELTEWMLFFEYEPWGTEVDLMGHGITASTVANVYRDTKKRASPFTPKEFMPKFEPRKRETKKDIAEKQLMQVQGLNAIFGGDEVAHGDNS